MASILVTGGCGFIGSALVKRLVQDGEKVFVFDNCSRGQASRITKYMSNAVFTSNDVRSEEDVNDFMSCGIDEVIHLASVNGTRHFYEKPAEVLDVGLRGICNIIEACKWWHVKKLMVMSSSEVYQTPPVIPTPETVPYSIPDPFNPRYSYAVQKIATEMVAIHNAKHFDKLIIVRPHNIYGPDAGEEHIIPRLARNAGSFYEGNQTRAFCYIDDAIDGLMLLRKFGLHNNIYNLGTQEEIAIFDLANLVTKITNRQVVMDDAVSLRKFEIGSTERRCPDISKIRALGYEPKVPLMVGLVKTLHWYANEKAPA